MEENSPSKSHIKSLQRTREKTIPLRRLALPTRQTTHYPKNRSDQFRERVQEPISTRESKSPSTTPSLFLRKHCCHELHRRKRRSSLVPEHNGERRLRGYGEQNSPSHQ